LRPYPGSHYVNVRRHVNHMIDAHRATTLPSAAHGHAPNPHHLCHHSADRRKRFRSSTTGRVSGVL
ncbi:MAG: hypothetical protein LC790_18300, partial [Actinobacteria bacterium]|nr:hypothetical protein [Actinomycetota bacterium]